MPCKYNDNGTPMDGTVWSVPPRPIDEEIADLRQRVKQFNTMSLPGQPMGMHMGTSYLVNGLDRALAEITAALGRAGATTVEIANERERQAREAERERMLKLGLSFISDQQAREDFIQLARSTPHERPDAG